MSRDIYVQDIPAEARSVEDIPDGWVPSPLPFGAAAVGFAVRELAPTADFTDPSWGQVSLPGADIEVRVGEEEPLTSFALHVRGSDPEAADTFIANLLARLGVRAFDPEGAEATGIFDNAKGR